HSLGATRRRKNRRVRRARADQVPARPPSPRTGRRTLPQVPVLSYVVNRSRAPLTRAPGCSFRPLAVDGRASSTYSAGRLSSIGDPPSGRLLPYERGDFVMAVQVENRQRRDQAARRVRRHGQDVRVTGVQPWLPDARPPYLELGNGGRLVALDEHEVAGREPVERLLQRELGVATQLVHQRPS